MHHELTGGQRSTRHALYLVDVWTCRKLSANPAALTTMQVSPAEMQAVRRVPLSSEALCLSFGHFLELSFGAHQLKIDDKSLHGDFVRYLGMGMSKSASCWTLSAICFCCHTHAHVSHW